MVLPLPPTRFAARYFNDAPPVFQRLFFTSEESSAVQYGPRRMKLRDLMGATLRFLQSDCAKFRMLWDWSPCVSQLLTSDVMVRGYEPTRGFGSLAWEMHWCPFMMSQRGNIKSCLCSVDFLKVSQH